MAVSLTYTSAQDDLDVRGDRVRLGVWMFLGTVTMLFAAFSSAYIVRRSGPDWRPFSLPAILWVNTAFLVASSAALEFGYLGGRHTRWRPALAGFLTALGLGLAFLTGQVIAWRGLLNAGIYLPSNPSSSFFYVLTGAHALHVVAALGVLAWGCWQTATAGRRDPREWRTAADVTRVFSHYLLGVWVYLLALVSLV